LVRSASLTERDSTACSSGHENADAARRRIDGPNQRHQQHDCIAAGSCKGEAGDNNQARAEQQQSPLVGADPEESDREGRQG